MLNTVSKEDLRVSLAKWMLRYNRNYSYQNRDDLRSDFIELFVVPETDFKYVGTSLDNDGKAYSVFKTSIKLSDWQSTDLKERKFEYYRLDEVIPNESDDMPDFKTSGYMITEF